MGESEKALGMLIIDKSCPIQLMIVSFDRTGIQIVAIPIGMHLAIGIHSCPSASLNSLAIFVDPCSSLCRFVLGCDHLQERNALVGLLQARFDRFGGLQGLSKGGAELVQVLVQILFGQFLDQSMQRSIFLTNLLGSWCCHDTTCWCCCCGTVVVELLLNCGCGCCL